MHPRWLLALACVGGLGCDTGTRQAVVPDKVTQADVDEYLKSREERRASIRALEQAGAKDTPEARPAGRGK